MITLNGWPQTSIKCLPEVSFYYQNEAKNNKPVKRIFKNLFKQEEQPFPLKYKKNKENTHFL